MNILSIDGGASRTRGVLFTQAGELLLYRETGASSLSRPSGDSHTVLAQFIQELADGAALSLEDVAQVNIGVAGVSNLDARERLFKELDRLRLSDRAMITSDVEAAYECVWGDGPGALVCVGTGAIGWARDEDGKSHRASGRGPQLGGDPGSGYWMGKKVMVQLIMNEDAGDDDLDALRRKVMDNYGAKTFEEAARLAGEGQDYISTVGRLGQAVCELADAGNEVALAIIQEGTQELGDELLQMIDAAGLRRDDMTLGIHGRLITASGLFRRMLEAALSYDLPRITWRTPDVDPVFGAALIAARLNDLAIDGESLKHSWSQYHLRSAS